MTFSNPTLLLMMIGLVGYVNVFLQYLENWKSSTLQRDGKYSADDRAKMFLSSQTHEGLQISVYSHIEAIQFLL